MAAAGVAVSERRESEGTLTLTQTWVMLGGRTSGDR